jgi:cytoskeletal protein RodZ
MRRLVNMNAFTFRTAFLRISDLWTVNEIYGAKSSEGGSFLDNHREFMQKHNFKMRCENQFLYSLGFVFVQILIFDVISRLLLLFSRARRMRSGSDKGLR